MKYTIPVSVDFQDLIHAFCQYAKYAEVKEYTMFDVGKLQAAVGDLQSKLEKANGNPLAL